MLLEAAGHHVEKKLQSEAPLAGKSGKWDGCGRSCGWSLQRALALFSLLPTWRLELQRPPMTMQPPWPRRPVLRMEELKDTSSLRYWWHHVVTQWAHPPHPPWLFNSREHHPLFMSSYVQSSLELCNMVVLATLTHFLQKKRHISISLILCLTN